MTVLATMSTFEVSFSSAVLAAGTAFVWRRAVRRGVAALFHLALRPSEMECFSDGEGEGILGKAEEKEAAGGPIG